MSDINHTVLEARTTRAEKEVKAIEEELDKLSKGDLSYTGDPRLDALLSDNEKLKHRLSVLENAIQVEKSNCWLDCCDTESRKVPTVITDLNSFEGNISVLDELKNIFEVAIMSAYPELKDPLVNICLCSNPKFGDYQCNSAMAVAQVLKDNFVKTNPREVANNILNKTPASPLIDKIEVAGAGYLNVYLSKKFIEHVLLSILRNGVKPPQTKRQRIVVDFSSPNIAKEMHVGHLRSTIIGDSICRILEFLNHDVLRINHLGDWGTQFGMLIAHMQDIYPDYLTNPPSISDLQWFYKDAKKRFDFDKDFKKRAYACVVELQSGHPEHLQAWKQICDVSSQDFQKIYDRLDIKIVNRGESFYQSRMDAIVQELKDKGLLEEDEGRLIMWGNPEKHDNIPLTIVKSDGGYTYDTSDMATIKQRVEEEKADRILYVTDCGQYTHFMIIEECAKRAGIIKEGQKIVQHVGFGVVLGEDKKKFKSRSGDTIKLTSLLDEAMKRALSKLEEKGRDGVLSPEEVKKAQEALGYGCIKYADLCNNRINAYTFSYEKMLDDRGNTAVYLLYTLTRIRSIARTAQISIDELLAKAEESGINLVDESEWRLAKSLLVFPEVLLRVAGDLYLHNLCDYIYDVSTVFNVFYSKCYCLQKDKGDNIVKIFYDRLILCEITARVMEKCLELLGLKTVSIM